MGLFDSNEPLIRRYEVVGKPVHCSHCGGYEFAEREAMLNTSGMTLMDLDWLNPSATALICEYCGHVEMFFDSEKIKRLD